MCWVLLCLHVEQPASGSEEGGSQFMQNTENFIMLCFVCSQFSAGQGKTHQVLDHVWCLHGASGVLQKVSFKNNLQQSR